MKKIILRLDLNTPINNNIILDTSKIDLVIDEIKRLTNKNIVTILSHQSENNSLDKVEIYIRKKLNKNQNQNLTILENTKLLKGETEKPSNKDYKNLVKYFSQFGEEYINDAFQTMHRNYASVVGLPLYFKKLNRKVSMGTFSKKEIKKLSKFTSNLNNKKNKNLLILGGAKVETKLNIALKLLKNNIKIFISGVSANHILKEILNINIGNSFIEKNFSINKKDSKIIKEAIKDNRIIVPIDAILNDKSVSLIEKINSNQSICDIGPATLALLKKEINNSNTIIMNGTLGIYKDGFDSGTKALLKELNKANKNTIIGGGDTMAIFNKLKIKNNKINSTTAGGAMLDFLSKDGKLPGILALK